MFAPKRLDLDVSLCVTFCFFHAIDVSPSCAVVVVVCYETRAKELSLAGELFSVT